MPKYYDDEPDMPTSSMADSNLVDLESVENDKNKLNDLSPMPFGKYKGKPMQDVPVDYLHWLWNKGVYGPVKVYIQENMNALKMENKDLIWRTRI